MKLTANKIKDINKSFALAIDAANKCGGLQVGDNGLEETSAIYRGNWHICNVEDLSDFIDALNLLRTAIEEETGVLF